MEAYKPGQGSLARLSVWVIFLLIAMMGVVEVYSWIQRRGDSALPPLHKLALFRELPLIGVPLSWKLLLCAVLLIGLLWFVRWYLNRPKTVDLLIETELEMKKVSWPTIDEAMNATWVVAFVTLILTATLFFFDFLLSSFFGFIF